MTDENGSGEYISFIKGYSAAMDDGTYGGEADSGTEPETGAYALGYAAAVEERELRPRYLDLSATAPIPRERPESDDLPDQGKFSGSLDLGEFTPSC